jgi:calcineurin-like phosphoesterase family protein
VKNKDFYLIGHAYGSHHGNNCGLNEQVKIFLRDIPKNGDEVFFLGDFIRQPTNNNIDCLSHELEELLSENQFYLIPGNHENSETARTQLFSQLTPVNKVIKQNGITFYVLDSPIEHGNFGVSQLKFLDDNPCQTSNCVLMFHEAVWNCNRLFSNSLSNSRSRYRQIKSNFYEEVIPITNKWFKQVYFISGDFGGNPDANTIEAYKYINNTYFIGVGIGESLIDSGKILKINQDNNSFELTTIDLTTLKKHPIQWVDYSTPISPVYSWVFIAILGSIIFLFNKVMNRFRIK